MEAVCMNSKSVWFKKNANMRENEASDEKKKRFEIYVQ